MPRITMEEPKEFTVMEEGTIIRVRVDGPPKVREVKLDDGREWEKLNWKFKIVEVYNPVYEEQVGENIYGDCSFNFVDHPDNKLKRWAEALLGMDLSIGFDLNTDDLDGYEAKALITTYTTKKGRDGHKVEDLMPLKEGVSRGPSAPSQQQLPQESSEHKVPF